MPLSINKSTAKVPKYIRPITLAILMKLLIENKSVVIRFVDDKGVELFYAEEFLEYLESELKKHCLKDVVACNSNLSER